MNDNKIEEKINSEIETFRKASDAQNLACAKLVKSALLNNSHSEKKVSEIEVLQKLVKEHEKAIDAYNQANRTDLAKQEIVELAYIKRFLPEEPTEEELLAFLKTCKESPMKVVLDTTIAKFPTARKGVVVKLYKSLL